MIEQTEPLAPSSAGPATPARTPWALARRHPALLTAGAVVLVALVLVRSVNTRPGFDPYGWLVWGHQTLLAALNTNAAPSWKPLPYVFTLPYALAGHYQLWLWMITSVAVSISGMIFAGRIAYRLTDAPPERRWIGFLAAVIAALAVNLIDQYWHYILSDQSDPMIASLMLGAIDCHLSKRPRWAFALGILASLGRPEIWPFVGLYAIWAWRAVPTMRRFLIVGFALLLLGWFGIPWISSRSPFVAADNALHSGRRLHNDLVFGTIGRYIDLMPVGLKIAALISVALAVWRRDRRTLALAGVVAIWVIVEVAMVLHGWPGVPRYMFGAAALTAVIAAIGLGRLLVLFPSITAPAGVAAAVVVAGLAASLVPPAISQARAEHKDLKVQQTRTKEINALYDLVAAHGGPSRFHPCGEPLTRLEYQSILAWTLHINVASVGFKYGPAIASGRPLVLFTPIPTGGWRIQALHQRTPACRALPS
jgi:hypothetical protein